MKKAILLLLFTATAALGAQYDLRYLQENASGKIVERTITLTPGTFLSVNGSGQLQVQSSDAFRAAIAAMPLAQRSTFNNAPATVASGTIYLGQTGTMSASRTVTLPAASSVSPGYQLVIADESGTVTNTNTIVIARAGSDTINGATSEIIANAYGHRRLISNGVNAWLFDGGVARLGASTQTFSGSVNVNGNVAAGDAAGDEFTASDDDPRFPNLNASSHAAANDPSVAINGAVGDVRYGGPIYFGRVTSDQNFTSTSYANSSLSFTLPAGTYVIQSTLRMSTASTSAGLNAQFRLNTSPDAGLSITTDGVGNAGITIARYGTGTAPVNIIAAATDPNIAGVPRFYNTQGTFVLSAQRTIALEVAQRITSDPSNPAVLHAGSWILIRKIQ